MDTSCAAQAMLACRRMTCTTDRDQLPIGNLKFNILRIASAALLILQACIFEAGAQDGPIVEINPTTATRRLPSLRKDSAKLSMRDRPGAYR